MVAEARVTDLQGQRDRIGWCILVKVGEEGKMAPNGVGDWAADGCDIDPGEASKDATLIGSWSQGLPLEMVLCVGTARWEVTRDAGRQRTLGARGEAGWQREGLWGSRPFQESLEFRGAKKEFQRE